MEVKRIFDLLDHYLEQYPHQEAAIFAKTGIVSGYFSTIDFIDIDLLIYILTSPFKYQSIFYFLFLYYFSKLYNSCKVFSVTNVTKYLKKIRINFFW